MSAVDEADYDDLVKDHLRMRLMESGWTDQVGLIIKNAIRKQVEKGQSLKSIKFEQLYKDVIDKARDALSNEIEIEFHEKISEYQSLKQSRNSEASSSSVCLPNSSRDVSNVSDDSSDIPSEIISNENKWREPKC